MRRMQAQGRRMGRPLASDSHRTSPPRVQIPQSGDDGILRSEPIYDDQPFAITPVYPDAYGQYPSQPWRKPDSEVYYDAGRSRTPPEVYEGMQDATYEWDSMADGLNGRQSERSYRSTDEVKREPKHYRPTDL